MDRVAAMTTFVRVVEAGSLSAAAPFARSVATFSQPPTLAGARLSDLMSNSRFGHSPFKREADRLPTSAPASLPVLSEQGSFLGGRQ